MPQKFQIINPPNTLKAKVGSLPEVNPEAIARAEQALKALAPQFADWIREEVDRLTAAFGAMKTDGVTASSLAAVFVCAHDLKGQGTTYNFPLVTEIAGVLCQLLDGVELTVVTANMALVEAHIQAIEIAVRDGLKDDSDAVAGALLQELKAQVQAVRAA